MRVDPADVLEQLARERAERATALQTWLTTGRALPLLDADRKPYSTAKALLDDIRKLLIQAHNAGLIASAPEEILKLLKRPLKPGEALADRVHRQLDAVPTPHARYVLLGGGVPKATDFNRKEDTPRFRRDDGASFLFRVIVEERGRNDAVVVLAYGAELWLPETSVPPWIRFDLNLPGHANDDAGHRSHMHPGTEAWSIPAPLFSPFELLDLMIHAARGTRHHTDQGSRPSPSESAAPS